MVNDDASMTMEESSVAGEPTGTGVSLVARSGGDRVRRGIDIVVALLGLLCSGPCMLAIALLIRIDSRGPALFWQTRLGRGATPFKFVKFRTLCIDARLRFPELYAYQYTDAELEQLPFKQPDDPRVTHVGRWLRRSSLDELPNLWNVLRGDMTLVGPRPEIPEMLQYYHGDMLEVFRVRPGVTGAAQVYGRARLNIAASIRIDVDYLRQRTLKSDLRIIARTVLVVLRREGAV